MKRGCGAIRRGGRALRHECRFLDLALGVLLLWPAGAYGAMDNWTGAGVNDNWTTLNNWSLGVPLPADFVTFNASDSGNTSIVNQDFTIIGLRYLANSTHTTNFGGTSHLQIDGPVYIGYGGSDNGATATWTNGGTVTIGDIANLRQWYIGYNGTTSATNVSALTINGPDVDAFVSTLAVAPNYSTGSSNSSLVLGDNSQLRVEASVAPVYLRVGYNQGGGSSTGLFDAAQGQAELHFYEMDIGYNSVAAGGSAGSATGTLRWDQAGPIEAEYVYFGRGPNAAGALDIPAGGTFRLGTAADPAGNLIVAYNNGGGSTSANLDLTTTNPTFETHLDDTLAVGLNYSTGTTDGKLILGDNSKLNVGTPSAPAKATVGYNRGLGGSGTGLLDASQGTLAMHLDDLLVGDNASGAPGALGTAAGTLTTGEETTITASTVHVGRGTGSTGTVNLNGGSFAANEVHLGANGQFNFTAGRLAVNTFITYGSLGDLVQHGGALAPGFLPADRTRTALAGLTTISGGYLLDSAGTLAIELFGTVPGVTDGFDQLGVFGPVNLDADGQGGGLLDVKLGFAPVVNAEFVIVDSYGLAPIAGRFRDLPDLATFEERFLNYLYTFQISYFGFTGTGNDVVLRVLDQITTIPAPGALLLAGLGMGIVSRLSRRRLL